MGDFVRGLPPSDRAIASVLAMFFAGACIVSLITLTRTAMVEVPNRGGHLTEGVVGNPRFVNPLLALTDADRDLATLTYAGLMGIGANGLHPVLAQSYEISPDGKTYTFVLKQGIKFTDGTPITAEDVVFTVQKAQDPGLKSPQPANWANVRAEAVDAQTVRFTLPKAYAPFLEDTTLGILPAHIWKGIANEQFPFDKRISEPVGSGPFKVGRVTRNRDGVITQYEVVANQTYALGRPYLNGITFKYYPSVDGVSSAYRSGAIDSGYGFAEPNARTAPYSRVFGVFFNPSSENKALAQEPVRKALSIAIDRSHMVNDILGGYAAPLTGPIPPGSGINGPELPTTDRIEVAREMLQDAGWTQGTTTGWTNAKLKLTLAPIVITTSNVPELKTLATSIEKDWEALGVETSLEYTDPSALVSTVIRPRSYDALFFGMVIGRDQDLFPFWDSSQTHDPGLNIAGYNNKNVDDLIEKARQEADPIARHDELQKISDAIAGDYPAAFTHTPDFVYVLPHSVQGVVLPQITSPADRFATVADWHVNSHYVWAFLVSQQ